MKKIFIVFILTFIILFQSFNITKVKFFYLGWRSIEQDINNFIKDKKIIDIKIEDQYILVIYEEL